MTEEQKDELIALLWGYLRRVKGHKDRRWTGWGTKTQAGLIASIERIFNDVNPN